MLEQQLKQRAADAPPVDPGDSLAQVVRRGRRRLLAVRAFSTLATVAAVAVAAVVLPSTLDGPPVPEVVHAPIDDGGSGDKTVDEATGSEPHAEKGDDGDVGVAPVKDVAFDVEITILHPATGTVTEAEEIAVEGVADEAAEVTVNGLPASRDGAAFRAVVPLDAGKNLVKAVASLGDDRWGYDKVVVTREVPEPDPKPKATSEPKEQPKDPEKSEPKPEPEPAPEVTFTAIQVHDKVEYDPPYSVYEGTAPAGALVKVYSDYGSAKTQAGEDGAWRVKVWFESAPYGTHTWTVTAWLYDTDHKHQFEFTGTRPEPESEVAFTANQKYGSSDAATPSDVFWGTAQPGTVVWVYSEYGEAEVTANDNGDWEVEVVFTNPPPNKPFPVKVKSLHTGEKVLFEFEWIQ
ncbi:MAG: hypothetical protein R3343_01230 [Nitriliruptorales bacterium]|nr:hypothetical protein [Nitriliruptorales bacterium]